MRRNRFAFCFAASASLLLVVGCGDRIDSSEVSGAQSRPSEAAILSTDVSAEECPEIGPPDEATLRQWLHAGNYAALEGSMQAHFAAYQRNALCELWLYGAYSAVADAGEDILPRLREWQRQSPESPEAHSAVARASRVAGYSARGDKFSSKTPKDAFARMHEHFAEGLKAANQAISLEPTLVVGYSESARMFRASGTGSKAVELVERLLKLDPRAFSPRLHAMFANQPRWGGKIREMQRIAEEAQAYVSENRRLRTLLGFVPAYHAAYTSGVDEDWDIDRSIELYTEALQYGDYGNLWSTRRGKAYLAQGNMVAAIRDANRAIQMKPSSMDAYKLRAKLFKKAGSWKSAIADLDILIEHEPNNRWRLKDRGWAHDQLGNLEAAVADYKSAIAAGADASTWLSGRLGYLLVDKLNLPAEAEPYLRRSTVDSPERHSNWYLLGRSLEAQGKDEARHAYERYVAQSTDDLPGDLLRAKYAMAYLERGGNRAAEQSASLPGMSLLKDTQHQ